MTNDRGSPLLAISCVDLFCGAGGLTHGLARGGVEVAAGIDVDPACRFPYEANNDARFLLRDVRALEAADLQSLFRPGAPRLLAGCAPCQPFSTYSRAGRGKRDDSEWELLEQFGRLAKAARPEFITMENVPEAARHSVFERFLECLDGYWISHSVVECERYGVPQTRKRLVLVASRIGPIELNHSDPAARPSTVRDAIGALAPVEAGAGSEDDPMHVACDLTPTNLQRVRASKPGGTWRDWPEHLRAKCHRRASGSTYPGVYGRMEWDRPSPTMTTQFFGYGNGRFGHPEQDRAITLREAAVLQTFPPHYRFLPEGERPLFHVMGRLIGNAVPVRLGEAIAQTFVRHRSEMRST